MEEDEGTRISLIIPTEMYDWLQSHKEINRSKLFRDAVSTISHPFYRDLNETLVLNLIVMLSVIAGFMLLFLLQYIAFFYILLSWVIISSSVITLTLTILKKGRSIKNGTKLHK